MAQYTLNHSGQEIENILDHALLDTQLITAGNIANNAVSKIYTVNLNNNWVGTEAPFTLQVAVNGLLESDTPIVDLILPSEYSEVEVQEEAWSYVYKATTSNNKITFYAKEKPTVSMQVQMMCIRK